MSDCGCKGYYHNGGCSDQNVIWWMGAQHGIPVNPTDAELDEQRLRNIMRGPLVISRGEKYTKVRYMRSTSPEMCTKEIEQALSKSMLESP